MHFPDLNSSVSWVLYKGTDLDGLCIFCPSQVWGAQVTRRLESALSYVGHASNSPPWFQPLSFPGMPWEHSPRCAVCLLWGSDLRLWYLWQISAVQDPRKTWWATGSLLSLVEDAVSGAKIAAAPCLPALALCFSASVEGGPYMTIWQPTCSPLVFCQSYGLWVCQSSPCNVRAFSGKGLFSLSLSLSLMIPWIGLLSHISSLRLSSGHSGPVLTLRDLWGSPCLPA